MDMVQRRRLMINANLLLVHLCIRCCVWLWCHAENIASIITVVAAIAVVMGVY